MTEASSLEKLKQNLEALRLHGIEINLHDYLGKIERQEISVVEAWRQLTDIELKLKEERAVQGCVKVANFPFLKTMKDFDFSFQPDLNPKQIYGFTDLRFIGQKENILFIGSPGVGKTHLSVSIGIEAAKNRKSTYFINCTDLLANLKKAKEENRFDERLKFYAKYRVLIIDEVGFLPLDTEASKMFFQLISRRYEKNSTIITTNIELSHWEEIFGDPVMATAILDRLLHHSHIIRIIGDSYRLKEVRDILSTY